HPWTQTCNELAQVALLVALRLVGIQVSRMVFTPLRCCLFHAPPRLLSRQRAISQICKELFLDLLRFVAVTGAGALLPPGALVFVAEGEQFSIAAIDSVFTSWHVRVPLFACVIPGPEILRFACARRRSLSSKLRRFSLLKTTFRNRAVPSG